MGNPRPTLDHSPHIDPVPAGAGLQVRSTFGCHTLCATGINAYLEASRTLENAQTMAAHESPRTTKLYDRMAGAITLDET